MDHKNLEIYMIVHRKRDLYSRKIKIQVLGNSDEKFETHNGGRDLRYSRA